jgi:hypothetical protein
MTPPEKVAAAILELGLQGANLRWQVSSRGKPHSFSVSFRDITVNGSTARAAVRALRRRFGQRIAA